MAGQFSSEVEKLVQQLLEDAAAGRRTTSEYLRGLVEGLPAVERLALLKELRSGIKPPLASGSSPFNS
jgi:hypothetical protein